MGSNRGVPIPGVQTTKYSTVAFNIMDAVYERFLKPWSRGLEIVGGSYIFRKPEETAACCTSSRCMSSLEFQKKVCFKDFTVRNWIRSATGKFIFLTKMEKSENFDLIIFGKKSQIQCTPVQLHNTVNCLIYLNTLKCI
jgi:hypothetical protein